MYPKAECVLLTRMIPGGNPSHGCGSRATCVLPAFMGLMCKGGALLALMRLES